MKKTRVFGILLASLLIIPAVAYAFTFYFAASNTFTVGSAFQVGQAYLTYNSNPETAFCTAGAFPSWSCPNPTTTIFPGDTLTYQLTIESDQSNVVAQASVSAGPFTQFTTSYSYQAVNQANSECLTGLLCSGLTPGLPTMTAGQWYSIFATVTITSGAPAGSATFQLDVGR